MALNDVSPRVVIVLVHGTFARDAKWTHPTSELYRHLRSVTNPEFVVFNWSGRNTNRARLKAGKELSALLRSLLKENPGRPVSVVAHSHGGNVALYAVKEIDSPNLAVITIATPFISETPRQLEAQLDISCIGIDLLIGIALSAIWFILMGLLFDIWIFDLDDVLDFGLSRPASIIVGVPIAFATVAIWIWYFFAPSGKECGRGSALLRTMVMGDFARLIQKKQQYVGELLGARVPANVSLLCLYTDGDEALTALRLVDFLGEISFALQRVLQLFVYVEIIVFAIMAIMFKLHVDRFFSIHFRIELLVATAILALIPVLFLFSPILLLILAAVRRIGYWDDLAMNYLHTRLWISPRPMTHSGGPQTARCYQKCSMMSGQPSLKLFRSLRHSALLESPEALDHMTSWLASWIEQVRFVNPGDRSPR
jgi:hypothetical protein